jgi:hypothetical protein
MASRMMAATGCRERSVRASLVVATAWTMY